MNLKKEGIADNFKNQGFVTLQVFDSSEFNVIKEFALSWIFKLLNSYSSRSVLDKKIEKYHIWSSQEKIKHSEMLCARNRHVIPSPKINKLLSQRLLEEAVPNFLSNKFTFWDEGLGWLAFRLVRPGNGDGYPLSKKEWGPAKNVISCWIPVLGHSSNETLALVPGSHRQSFPKYLPKESKFTKDEFRFAGDRNELKIMRPELKEGEVVFFHPALLHEEEIPTGSRTRFNLEIRLSPQT
jgi:hypothetical protein